MSGGVFCFVVFVCLGSVFWSIGLFGLGFFPFLPVGKLQGNLMESLEACVCGSCASALNLCNASVHGNVCV